MTGLTKRALLAAAAAALLIGLASAQDTHGVARPDPPQSVRVADVPILKFATLYVAQDRGLFAKYGLDVDLESVASGTEAIAFLEQGQIDVGGIAIVTSLWNGWNQGIDVRVFAPGGLEPFVDSPTKLLVRKDLHDSGAVTSPADLRGRTVAFAGGPGSGGEYLTAKALEPAGLAPARLGVLGGPGGGMPPPRQRLLVRGARHRPVDRGELPAALLVPGPHLRRHVVGRFAHRSSPCLGKHR